MNRDPVTENEVDDNMLKMESKLKVALRATLYRLRYPFLKHKIYDFQPNVYFGYTDHPLDYMATPILTPFSFLDKTLGKRSSSVLAVELEKRSANSFKFKVRGYDIYKIRNLDTMIKHEYCFDENTKYKRLTLQLDFLTDATYRLRLCEGEEVPENRTPMIDGDITDPSLSTGFEETDDKYVITTGRLRVEVIRNPFAICVYDGEGRLITESGSRTKSEFPPSAIDSFPLGFYKNRGSRLTYACESFVLYPGEAIFGLGEQFGPVNKMGRTVSIWNNECLHSLSNRTYKNIPFFMSTQGYGVFINESRPATLWIGSREVCKNQIAVEGELLDYFFFYGPGFKQILNDYTNLTGKPAVVPKWTLGTWISRISYFSEKQVLKAAQTLREQRFPADVINIDTGWFEKDWHCDWQFDKDRFPDPGRMFDKLKDMGFRASLWNTPYVLKATSVYADAKKRRALAKNRAPFFFIMFYPARVIDFSRSEGVAWFKERLRPLFRYGAATMKTDFAEGVEPAMQFAAGDGRKMHNLLPLLYQKAAFEAVQEVHGEKEGVCWSRSAYAGSQRYPLHWGGDNSANYENLLPGLRGGLSLGLCGFSFWSHDTGGYLGVPSDELYIRWTAFSIFQSHIRYHGNPPNYKEPWNFSDKVKSVVRELLELRYQLIPYIYSECHSAAGAGLPVLRHMVIEHHDDPTVYSIEDQFYCGDRLLVAPVLSRNNSRRIYLPEGLWYDLFSAQRITGPCWIEREVALEEVPVFIRGGTIFPLGKAAQCTRDLSLDDLRLVVCPDEAGKAAYRVIDDGLEIELNAHDDNGVMQVQVNGPIKSPSVEIHEAYAGGELSVNLSH